MTGNKYDRILRVLEFLAAQEGGATLSEVAAASGLPVSTCHDVLRGLVAADAASSLPERRYALGRRVRTLAARIYGGDDVIAWCKKELPALAEALSFDVYLAVPIENEVVYVEHVRGSHPVNVNVPLGRPVALHATAVGKLFAAYSEHLGALVLASRSLPALTDRTITDVDVLARELASIRRAGCSSSAGEGIRGVSGLAVPVFDLDGRIAAAIHLSALTEDLDRETSGRAVEAMRRVAERIGSQLT